MYLTLFLMFIGAVALLGVCCVVVLRRSGEMYLPKVGRASESEVAEQPALTAPDRRAPVQCPRRSFDEDDTMLFNPATGLPMVGAWDTAGNLYGCSGSSLFKH